jgi:LPS-assembly protein
VSANTYEVEDAHFTSCTQPNPRWSFSASSATLKVDDHIRGKNVVFRVKDVPAFYFPYFIYPIEDDQRSSGILFPHFGRSDVRGYNIGTGFFWAMNRSFDQTFYVDMFSKTGYGLGHEFRYTLQSPSRGNFRSYGFRRTDAGGWEHDVNWNAVQILPGKWRATVDVREVSTLAFQEEFQENLDRASSRDRRSSIDLQRNFGSLNLRAFADSADYFFGSDDSFARKRHLPALLVSQSNRKLGRTGLVFGFETRAERLAIGNQDGVNQYSRFDLYPRLSRPMSVSFLQVTPQVQVRATRYGASLDEGAFVDGAGLDRRYLESSVEARGPTFSRVFENKGGPYSDRFKHVIGPEVTYTYRSKVDEFDAIPRFDHLDTILGTNEIHYALVQRLYAKRPGLSGKLEAYEFVNWRVAQTYYVDIAEGQNEFDPNYSSAAFGPDGLPAHYSPLQSRLRVRPTPRLQSNFDVEYDVNLRVMRRLGLSMDAGSDLARLRLGWSRSRRAAVNAENRVLQSDTLTGSTRFQAIPRRLTIDASADYDLLTKTLYQVRGMMRYDVQCCGFVMELNQFDYNARKERQIRWAIELANIGSIGNFMGAENSGFLGRR